MSPTFLVETDSSGLAGVAGVAKDNPPGEIAEIYLAYASGDEKKGPWVAQYGVPHHWSAGGMYCVASIELAKEWLKSLGIKLGKKISDEPIRKWGSSHFGDATDHLRS
ncbi:MAG: hypothetical protein WAV40_02245 [Microgenomates group bacterium]